ncbi:MAG: flagellar motor switch protein FliG [Spirochaetaceae bacterium]|jgi:flagellar motor switch protein FliG|nr:flagellar motor switch protein FliG [Spirochaetaceae bacterium]
MINKKGVYAYLKTLSKEKPLDPKDDDWLERVAAYNAKEGAPKQDAPSAPAPGSYLKKTGVVNDSVKAAGAKEAFLDFIKTPVKIKKEAADLGKETAAPSEDSKYRKVAKFLILIGAEQASAVLANLDAEQVELVSREIASIRGITSEEAASIFKEFQELFASSFGFGGVAKGGVEEARRLLYAAFGPEKGEKLLKNAVPGASESSFSFLEDISGEQIAMLLRDETPAAAALVLARVNPKVAAQALIHTESAWRLEVVRRIGRLGKASPEVLEKTAEALRKKMRRMGNNSTSNVDGMGALASILKQSDVSFGDRILGDLAKENPILSRELKERLYTMDDVVKSDNKSLRIKLHEMSVKEIAFLVKGRKEDFVEKILSNISSNRKIETLEELEIMGPVSKKDLDASIKNFMKWFREGRESGSILMEDDDLVK